MRVFFDASVLIAALLSPTGGSSLLLQLHNRGTLIGITSQTVIDEVSEQADKIQRTNEDIAQFIAQSGLAAREAVTRDEIAPYHGLIDKEDAHLIVGANSTHCEYLVSLDKKHVLREDGGGI